MVTIFGPYRGAEAELFTEGLDEWASLQGIDVRYTGSGGFASDLQYRVNEILSPPDIAIVPQPGLVREFAANEALVPFSQDVTAAISQHYDEDVLDLGTVDGRLVAFPYRQQCEEPRLVPTGHHERPRPDTTDRR